MEAALQSALNDVLQPDVLVVILLAAIYGVFVGAIPGLTATMAVALLVPLTFFLDTTSAIAAIVTTVTCSIFAGDIPGTLLRIPGTPASAAYTLDAYALTRQGEHEKSLGVSLIFSVLGGFFGVAVLLGLAPQLAKLHFTAYEYFWLYVVGLSCAAVVSRESRWKGTLALAIGLLISTVGLSADHDAPRFAFHPELYAGINFLPAMIGLFGVSEILRNALRLEEERPPTNARRATADGEEATATAGPVRKPGLASWLWGLARDIPPFLWVRKLAVLRSSAIGSFVGMLPGAGADLAAWISYAVSKRFSKKPETYGRGSLEGIGDATSANNSALASAWVPSLVFGIPGDSVTAIALGVLLMHNVQPGPEIFTSPDRAVLAFAILVIFVIANLILIPVGLAAIRMGSLLVRVPRRILLPIILVFCILGAYSLNANEFDIWVILAMGLLGFFLEGLRIPLAPIVLGILLGGDLEHRFVQSLAESDAWWDFIARPASAVLALAALTLWIGPTVRGLVRRIRRKPGTSEGPEDSAQA